MATMYCALCGRPVEAARRIGAGTVALAFVTMGLSLLAVPFYAKRCSICGSSAVMHAPPAGATGPGGRPLDRLAQLEQRLQLVEQELELASGDLRRLTAERDFYAQLLADPTARDAASRRAR